MDMIHYHSCPLCYEKWRCQLNCTIEPDLCYSDKLFSSHEICPECEKFTIPLTKEWFLIYNGFVK
jgi:hypothetical protein